MHDHAAWIGMIASGRRDLDGRRGIEKPPDPERCAV
jgi:hypothetical protein